MALQITLTHATGSPAYTIKADKIVHSFVRFPTQAPLPGVTGTATPAIFTLDLGMLLEQISITGIVDTASPGGSVPSKANLVSILRTWWNYGGTATDLPYLTIGSSESYYGHLKNADFTQEGALEDRWLFSMIFLVRAPKP